MDFTLWNFKDWFSQNGISHSYNISNTSALIEHISFAGNTPGPGTAVISGLDNNIRSSFYRCRLSYCHDEILFPVTPPETVYNLCQDMLSFYSDWENNINEMIASGASIDNIIEAMQKAFPHPLAVIFRKDGLCHLSPDWKLALGSQELLRLSGYFKPAALSAPAFVPASLFGVSNMICGFEQVSKDAGIYILTYDEKSDIKAGELHIFSMICKLLRRALLFHAGQQSQFHPLSEWFSYRIMSPFQPHPVDTQALHHIGWKDSDRYLIVCIRTDDCKPVNLFHLRSILTETNRCCISTAEGLSVLVNIQDAEFPASSAELRFILRKCEKNFLITGISLPFTGLDDVPFYYEQANHSAELAVSRGEKCCFTQEHLSDFILDHCSTIKDVQAYVHPGVSQLIRIDRAGHDDLVQTLYTYLFFGRSYTRTSEKLNVHRNTLRQRLSKISRVLSPEDLQGPELEHVMMSLLLNYRNFQ